MSGKGSCDSGEAAEHFCPIPLLARSDARLTGRHWRVLAAITYRDRFNRNGRGYDAGPKKLAEDAKVHYTDAYRLVHDLAKWGHVRTEPNPKNKRLLIIRAVYDDPVGIGTDETEQDEFETKLPEHLVGTRTNNPGKLLGIGTNQSGSLVGTPIPYVSDNKQQ